MKLSDELIKKYQKLYKDRFGQEISRERALAQGLKFVRMVELVYKPMTEDEYSEIERRRSVTNNTSI